MLLYPLQYQHLENILKSIQYRDESVIEYWRSFTLFEKWFDSGVLEAVQTYT
jgi:hypothetical protein